MKLIRSLRAPLAILLAMMMLIGMMSFASAEEEKPLIGILAPETTHKWVSGVAYYAPQKAEELELNYTMQTGADAEELTNYMDQMVDMGAKAILLWTQFDGMELAVERALEKGAIPQETFDSVAAASQAGRRPPWDTPLGGFIMIHGGGAQEDWTAGCIALENADIDILWEKCPLGTPVHILP